MEVFWKERQDIFRPRQAAVHDVPGEAVQGGHQLQDRQTGEGGSSPDKEQPPAPSTPAARLHLAPGATAPTCAASSGLAAMAGQARCASGPSPAGGLEKQSWHSCRTASFDGACRGAKRDALSRRRRRAGNGPRQRRGGGPAARSPSAGPAGRRTPPHAAPPSWRPQRGREPRLSSRPAAILLGRGRAGTPGSVVLVLVLVLVLALALTRDKSEKNKTKLKAVKCFSLSSQSVKRAAVTVIGAEVQDNVLHPISVRPASNFTDPHCSALSEIPDVIFIFFFLVISVSAMKSETRPRA